MIVDIVIISIMVLAALIGLAIGFYKSILGFFAWGIAFVATFFLSSVIANALIGIDAVGGFLFGGPIFYTVRSFIGNIAVGEGIVNAILAPLAPNVAGSALVANGSVSANDANIALMVFGLFTGLIAFVLFGLVRLILIPVVHALKKVGNKDGKKKRIGAASRIFGFLVGGGKGLIWAMTVFMFLGFVAPVVPVVQNQIDTGFMGGPIFTATAWAQTRFLGSNNGINRTLALALPHVHGLVGDYEGGGETDTGGTDTDTDTGDTTTPQTTRAEVVTAFEYEGFYVTVRDFTAEDYDGAFNGVQMLSADYNNDFFKLFIFPVGFDITADVLDQLKDADYTVYTQGRFVWQGTPDALAIFEDLIVLPAPPTPPDCAECDDYGCAECKEYVIVSDCVYCDDAGCLECE